MHGIELLARRFGALLVRNPLAWPDTVETLTEDVLDANDTLAALGKAAANDAELAAYVSYCNKEIEKRNAYDDEANAVESRARNREKISAKRVLAAADSDTALNKGFYRTFGRFATDDELELAFQKLLVSETPAVCARLLWIFKAVKVPRLEEKIFELARHENVDVRYSATDTLSKFSDSRVRVAALAGLAADPQSVCNGNVLKLFIRNYRDGDETSILSGLERMAPRTEDQSHDIACSLVKICEENPSATIPALAAWVATTVQCSVCRRRAITSLVDRAALPDAIAQECLFDADPATQLFVSNSQTRSVKL
ncbi:MAG: HEAT repeat domain-containing protein [Telluria sp.]